jgi:hypothetical protein
MIVNSQNFNLYKLVFNSSLLDSFEYSYLCPLLKQTGLHSGHVDIILTANKLSHQAEAIKRLKKKIENSLNNTHKFIKKKCYIHRLVQLSILNQSINEINHEKLLVEYYSQYLILEIYLFQPSVFFDKSFCELFKPIINEIQIEFIKQNTFDESVFACVIVFLVYKTWKIEYWYPFVSKLAFNSKEIGIAKYFIQIAKLEYSMLFMLINLFE